MFAFVTFVDSESAAALIELGEDHLINGCSVAFASPMKPNEKRQGGRQGGGQGGGQGWGSGGSGGYGAMPPKMPENPMEAMGMAMAMINTWMSPDGEAGKKKNA